MTNSYIYDHALIRFWNHAYEKYKLSLGGRFAVFETEGMEDPILSPCFDIKHTNSHFNAIIPMDEIPDTIADFKIRNNFFLCVMDSMEAQSTLSCYFKVQDLSTVYFESSFWNLLKDGFAKDYEFLKDLMRFLPSLNATFEVGLLVDQDRVFGSVVMGFAKDTAVLLSGVIHSDYRDKLHTRNLDNLVKTMAVEKKIKEIFYWTMEEELTRYADHTDQYLIYTKS